MAEAVSKLFLCHSAFSHNLSRRLSIVNTGVNLMRAQFHSDCHCERSVAISRRQRSLFQRRDRHVVAFFAMTNWVRVSGMNGRVRLSDARNHQLRPGASFYAKTRPAADKLDLVNRSTNS